MDTESQELHNKVPILHSTCYLTSPVSPARPRGLAFRGRSPTNTQADSVHGSQELSDMVERLRGPQGWAELEFPPEIRQLLTWNKLSYIMTYREQRTCWGLTW